MNSGTLNLTNVTVSHNNATLGALYDLGTETLTDCTVSSNTGMGIEMTNGTLTFVALTLRSAERIAAGFPKG